MTEESEFDRLLKLCPEPMRRATIDVSDTMWMAMEWFRARRMEPTADAIVQMAALILQREALSEGKDAASALLDAANQFAKISDSAEIAVKIFEDYFPSKS